MLLANINEISKLEASYKYFEGIENICKLLNGKKTLILGNHDSFKKVKIYTKYLVLVF